MKIVDVEALYLRLPEVKEQTDSSQDALLVKITTDEGIIGWGEVDSSPFVIKAVIEAPYSHTLARGLRHSLIGEDPLRTDYLWEKMYRDTIYFGREGAAIQAMAGVDIALWDIKGKAHGEPIWSLLGGTRNPIRAYSSNLFCSTPEATAERAQQQVGIGYSAVKFGWEPFGRGSVADDRRYLQSLRSAIGEDIDLIVDVGLVWDAATTIQRCHEFEEFNLFWIEEPLPPDDILGYREVSEHVVQRVAAGEEESTVAGHRRLIEEGAIGLAQIDLTRCGITQSLKIADLAHDNGIPIANHCFTTDINVAAALHLLASIPNALILETCAEESILAHDLVTEPIPVIEGYASPPEGPGLGVEPDLALIERYLVRSEQP